MYEAQTAQSLPASWSWARRRVTRRLAHDQEAGQDIIQYTEVRTTRSRRAKLGQIQGGLQRAIQDSTKGGLQ